MEDRHFKQDNFNLYKPQQQQEDRIGFPLLSGGVPYLVSAELIYVPPALPGLPKTETGYFKSTVELRRRYGETRTRYATIVVVYDVQQDGKLIYTDQADCQIWILTERTLRAMSDVVKSVGNGKLNDLQVTITGDKWSAPKLTLCRETLWNQNKMKQSVEEQTKLLTPKLKTIFDRIHSSYGAKDEIAEAFGLS